MLLFLTSGDVSDTKPSTALLVERADSVIVCIHAQIPKNDDLDPEEFRAKAVKIMENLGCDTASIKQTNKTPAAIWTIFHPSDGDKIRDLLNKVAVQEKRPRNYDPFLEENVVLDDVLTKRLKDEYDVKPYVITQFQGEAIFIPAGSPRQVLIPASPYSFGLEKPFVNLSINLNPQFDDQNSRFRRTVSTILSQALYPSFVRVSKSSMYL